MSDEPQAPVTPPAGDASVTPPAQAATTTPTPEPQAGDGLEHISLEEARKLRRENQTLRQRQKQLDEAEEAAKAAQLSEVERTKREHDKLKAEHDAYRATTQKQMVRYEVAAAAASLNIIHPDAAAKLLDESELEYDEDGKPTNARALLEKLLKNMPYLARAVETPTAPENKQPTPAPHVPTVPAMNPGRSQIAAPAARTPGQKPSWNDVYKRP